MFTSQRSQIMTSTLIILVFFLGIANAFDPRLLAGGMWQKTPIDHVRLQYMNNELLAEFHLPGLYFIGTHRYRGWDYKDMPTDIQHDSFGPITGVSKNRTPWSALVTVANQVEAFNMVDVVRLQTTDYDKKLKAFVVPAFMETMISLSNEEIGMTRTAELNEILNAKIRASVYEHWGDIPINLPYVLVENLKCLDQGIIAQWQQQNQHRIQLETTKLKAKAEEEEHKRQQAAQDAFHRKEMSKAEHEVLKKQTENLAIVERAQAEADAAGVKAEQNLDAEQQHKHMLEKYPVALEHERAIKNSESKFNNAKTHTVVLGTESAASSAAKVIKSFF